MRFLVTKSKAVLSGEMRQLQIVFVGFVYLISTVELKGLTNLSFGFEFFLLSEKNNNKTTKILGIFRSGFLPPLPIPITVRADNNQSDGLAVNFLI